MTNPEHGEELNPSATRHDQSARDSAQCGNRITSMHHQQMFQHMDRVGNALRDLIGYVETEDLDPGFLRREDGTYPFSEDLMELLDKVLTAADLLYDRARAERPADSAARGSITG